MEVADFHLTIAGSVFGMDADFVRQPMIVVVNTVGIVHEFVEYFPYLFETNDVGIVPLFVECYSPYFVDPIMLVVASSFLYQGPKLFSVFAAKKTGWSSLD